ncbi:MAG TPA: oxygenase MpaB family protein [Ilumatobacter sp.]|nr:oxygenase MpaB family protein [Ilumatobacter sp.]
MPRSAPIDDLRAWVAGRVRAGVVGSPEHAMARHAALFDAPGERWFAPDAAICRVHGDSAMFVGGLRALLLQSLHPLAMAGVAEHSDYRHDPWGRLQRTADFLAATTYGPASEAERAVAIVRTVHERVTGTAPDGRPYAANDPHLLRWVHLAEIDSFLAAYDRYGADSLTASERDEYVRDTAVIARALGVPAPPQSVRAMRDQLRMFRPELAGSPAARDAARYLLLQPPMPLAVRPLYGVLAAAAVALLPRWARGPLWLPYLPVAEAVVVRPAGDALTRTLRWALRRDEASA